MKTEEFSAEVKINDVIWPGNILAILGAIALALALGAPGASDGLTPASLWLGAFASEACGPD